MLLYALHCLGGERLTPKILDHYLHHESMISSLLYHSRPLRKISAQSVHNILSYVVHNQQTDKPILPKTLEALGECRTPWPRQIITPILPTVKMFSIGGEMLTPNVLDHYFCHDLVMVQLLWCFIVPIYSS